MFSNAGLLRMLLSCHPISPQLAVICRASAPPFPCCWSLDGLEVEGPLLLLLQLFDFLRANKKRFQRSGDRFVGAGSRQPSAVSLISGESSDSYLADEDSSTRSSAVGQEEKTRRRVHWHIGVVVE